MYALLNSVSRSISSVSNKYNVSVTSTVSSVSDSLVNKIVKLLKKKTCKKNNNISKQEIF